MATGWGWGFFSPFFSFFFSNYLCVRDKQTCLSCGTADRNNFLFPLRCLPVRASNRAASQLSRMERPITRLGGLALLSAARCSPQCLCLGDGAFISPPVSGLSVYASIRLSIRALIYLFIHPFLHHCYLMRWHHTSRFIGCAQTNPDLIRPPLLKRLPSLPRRGLRDIMTHLHLTT